MTLRLSPRAWRLVAISYAVKTVIIAAACLMVPDLPQQAWSLLLPIVRP